jgi:hypothetical protein
MENMDYKISFMIYSPYGQDYDHNYNEELKLFNYNESMVSLGSQTRETFDRSLDSASIQICLSNRPVEFQPYTLASLLFYTLDEEDKVKEGKYHLMVIESDKVEEQFIGDMVKYNHNVILVEATKMLETELMPNITFTQPVKNITLGTQWSTYHQEEPQAVTEAKGSVTPLNAVDVWSGVGTVVTNILLSTFTGAGGDVLGGLLAGCLSILVDSTGHDEWRTALQSMKVKANIPDQNIPAEMMPGYKFPMITQTIDLEGFLQYTETLFGNNGIFSGISQTLTNPVLGILNIIKLAASIFSGGTNIKIILYPCSVLLINKTTEQIWELTNTVTDKETESSKEYLGYKIAKWASRECSYEQELIVPDDITPGDYTVLYTYDFKKLWMRNFGAWPFYVPYEDAQIDKPIQELNNRTVADIANTSMMMVIDGLTVTQDLIDIGLGNIEAYYDTNYIYLDEFLHRIEDQIICKKEIKPGVFKEPKFRFSDNTLAIAKTIKCPEFTFEKKTLWEICLEIGELFHGIPRLKEGNIIDYDIITDNAKKTLTFNRGTQEAEYNMANYATRLFTPELKNIILDNIDDNQLSYVYYPYKGGWTKVRAKEYSETNIDRQSSVIHIENGENMSSIYKIKQLWCRTKVKGAIKEFNITNYIVEKNVWDSLSNNIETSWFVNHECSEKGIYLYFIQGDNNIYNVAQLPDNRSLIGWKQTFLTIQYILARQYNVPLEDSSKNIFDYEFQVIYAPYNSRMNITRNSNLSDIYTQISSNFNQPSKNISAKAFSAVSQNLLETMCKPTVKTSYITNLIDDGLEIGDCINLKGHNYYINTKVVTYGNNSKEVALELSRDNYKQNERISVSREYRPYNIDSTNLVRKTLSSPFSVIVGEGDYTELADDTSYLREYNSANKQTIAKSIRETLTRGVYSKLAKLSLAYVEPLDVEGKLIKYNTFRSDVDLTTVQPKLLPVVSDVLGNTMSFQWNMFDNYSAGRKIQRPSDGSDGWWNELEVKVGTLTLKEKDYGLKMQMDARYCDDIGATPRIYTSFFGLNESADLGSGYNPLNNLEDPTLGGNLPDANGITRKGITSTYAQNELTSSFYANKDSREELSYQMTISAQTFDPYIDIYDIFKYNPLVSDRVQESPKWYGYTNENIPDDSGFYDNQSGRNESYILTSNVQGPYEIKGDVAVSATISNNTETDFVGFVLVSPADEVFLNIRKPLSVHQARKISFTVFNDEMTYRDIKHTSPLYVVDEPVPFDLPQIQDYQPVVSYRNGKYYLDLNDLFENTGLTRDDIEVSLVTKHNTLPRGIRPGFRGRKNCKCKEGSSLYKISNVYLDNPSNSNRYLFNKLLIGNNGEIYYKDTVSARFNISNYLNNKQISKQDYGSGKIKHQYLYYGFVIKYKGIQSRFKTNFRYTYNDTRYMTKVDVF